MIAAAIWLAATGVANAQAPTPIPCPVPRAPSLKAVAGALKPDTQSLLECLKNELVPSAGNPLGFLGFLANYKVTGAQPLKDCSMPKMSTPTMSAFKTAPSLFEVLPQLPNYKSIPEYQKVARLYRMGQNTAAELGGAKGGTVDLGTANSMFSSLVGGCKVDMSKIKDPMQMYDMATKCGTSYLLSGPWKLPQKIADKIQRVSDRINEKACQPLRIVPKIKIKQEYRPDYYMSKIAKEMDIPMSPDFPMPAMTPALMGIHQVERIYHPDLWAPRGDFQYNERKAYSPATASYGYGGSDKRCAVACAGVPVDVMRFRSEAFSAAIAPRIADNITVCSSYPVFQTLKGKPCCGRDAPCATRFDDKRELKDPTDKCWLHAPVLDFWVPIAPHGCMNIPSGFSTYTMLQQACFDLSRELEPINSLKIATISPVNNNFWAGSTFFRRFGWNKPYISRKDLGHEAGGSPSPSLFTYSTHDAYNMLGALDILIGVGREGNILTGQKSQNCGYGGTGAASDLDFLPKELIAAQFDLQGMLNNLVSSVPGAGFLNMLDNVKIDKSDPVKEASSLPRYQAETTRTYGLACIGKYEQLFKIAKDPADFAARTAGGMFNTYVKDPAGKLVPQMVGMPFYLSHRGTASDRNPATRFPYYGMGKNKDGQLNNKGMVGGGLDYAQPGDQVLIDEDIIKKLDLKMLPTVMTVVQAANIPAKNGKPSYSYVEMKVPVPDIPDICGSKPKESGATIKMFLGEIPDDIKGIAATHKIDLSCENLNLAFCNAAKFKKDVKIYRPRDDVRQPASNKDTKG